MDRAEIPHFCCWTGPRLFRLGFSGRTRFLFYNTGAYAEFFGRGGKHWLLIGIPVHTPTPGGEGRTMGLF